MAIGEALERFLESTEIESEFQPYHELNPDSDTLTFYFRGDPDYSKRLTDHVTLYYSLSDDELVGCRVKGIAGILADLPNYIGIAGTDGGLQLSLVFLPFHSEVRRSGQRALNDIAKAARGQTIDPGCGA